MMRILRRCGGVFEALGRPWESSLTVREDHLCLDEVVHCQPISAADKAKPSEHKLSRTDRKGRLHHCDFRGRSQIQAARLCDSLISLWRLPRAHFCLSCRCGTVCARSGFDSGPESHNGVRWRVGIGVEHQMRITAWVSIAQCRVVRYRRCRAGPERCISITPRPFADGFLVVQQCSRSLCGSRPHCLR
jgi:hypothetical protein